MSAEPSETLRASGKNQQDFLKVAVEGTEETLEMPDAPFDRVDNGYDPSQVAAFAAQALSWKRELAEARAALKRYEQIIGEIDEIEREAAQIVDEARLEAEKIIEQAHARTALPPRLTAPHALADEEEEQQEDDLVLIQDDLLIQDEEKVLLTREEKIQAAREHLYRRRGVILPQE